MRSSMLQRGRRSESTEMSCSIDAPDFSAALQRGRRSESTEISTKARWQTRPLRFKGAVDQSRRRYREVAARDKRAAVASKGPSIRVDGDDLRRAIGRGLREASKGPSIRVDGDVPLRQGARARHVASKGPSIRVDGDPAHSPVRCEADQASKGPSIRVDGDAPRPAHSERLRDGFKGAVDQSRRRCAHSSPGVLKPLLLQRGRRSESTEIGARSQ